MVVTLTICLLNRKAKSILCFSVYWPSQTINKRSDWIDRIKGRHKHKKRKIHHRKMINMLWNNSLWSQIILVQYWFSLFRKPNSSSLESKGKDKSRLNLKSKSKIKIRHTTANLSFLTILSHLIYTLSLNNPTKVKVKIKNTLWQLV